MSGKCLKRSLVVALLAVSGVGAAGRDMPLIEAVKNGDTAAVRALLDKGGDVNAPDVDGTTVLHWAVSRDNLEVADLLIRAGANVRATNRYGVAPLSLACLNGNVAMVGKLLQAGADPKSTQPGGEIALMTAARTGNAAVVQQLLTRGADVNATEEWKGQTALMWAAAENNAAAVKALIAGGADIPARSNISPGVNELANRGFTAFTFAARAGAIDAAEALLEGGASVNDTLADGTSALVLAVMRPRCPVRDGRISAGPRCRPERCCSRVDGPASDRVDAQTESGIQHRLPSTKGPRRQSQPRQETSGTWR